MIVFLTAAFIALVAVNRRTLSSIQHEGWRSLAFKCASALLVALLAIPAIIHWQAALLPYANAVAPYFALIVYGFAFGGVLKVWLERRAAGLPAEQPDAPSSSEAKEEEEKPKGDKTKRAGMLLAQDLPWVLVTGAIFFLGLFSAPEFSFMKQVRAFKAGAVELQFQERLQSGKAERFQLFRLSSPYQVSALIDGYQAIFAFEETLLAEQLNPARYPFIENRERAKELHQAHAEARRFFEKIFLPVLQCGRAAERHAPPQQVIAALGMLPNRLWQFLQVAESKYDSRLLSGNDKVSSASPVPEVEAALQQLVDAAVQANESMRKLGELPADSAKLPAAACQDDVDASAIEAGAPHRYRLLQSPSLYRVLASIYRYAGRQEFVPKILTESISNRYEWDARIPLMLASVHANLPQPDLGYAIQLTEIALSRVTAIEAFFGPNASAPRYLGRVKTAAQNNLAFYLTEAVRETPRAVRLARAAFDAEPSAATTHTLAFAMVVDAVHDQKLSSSEKKAVISQAINMAEGGLLKAKSDGNMYDAQWFRLHLDQARDIYKALN